MIEERLLHLEGLVYNKIAAFTKKKHWKIKLSVILFLTALFLNFPSYDLVFNKKVSYINETWEAIETQIKNPFSPSQNPMTSLEDSNNNFGAHVLKTQYRLTGPLICKMLKVKRHGALLIQLVSFYLFFLFLVLILSRDTKDDTTSFLLSIAISLTTVGSVLVFDYRGTFDVLGYLFLVMAIYFRNYLFIYVCLIMASFVDERSFICTSFVFCYYMMNKSVLSKLLIVVVSWVSVLLIRAYLKEHFNLELQGWNYIEVFIVNLKYSLLVFWTSFESLWLINFLAIFLLFVNKSWVKLSAVIIPAFVILIVSLITGDVSRSMCFSFILILVSILVLIKFESVLFVRRFVLILSIFCLLPNMNITTPLAPDFILSFPLQILRIYY